ncbi:hypothetical protein KIN20_020493 [Parelaphostrongylus tenuis]|uniref:Uncharacterized protein n=1 Tax=Parelaphostrongylus tenuis TaxID=148309 RepID=A0AAD5MMQ2_PARTN|nr:hypothetical protein KIN20_020493 [Parelaphostrongylus tenuis]
MKASSEISILVKTKKLEEEGNDEREEEEDTEIIRTVKEKRVEMLELVHRPLLDDLEQELPLYIVYKTANDSFRCGS